MNRTHLSSILQVLLAAVLFGASAPLSKLFLGAVEPIPLAAFLYLGSGFGIFGVKLFQRLTQPELESEARVTWTDFPWLMGAIVAGGIAAPITLLFSLRNTPAATASLLLSFEGVATTLIALIVFKESISRRAGWAIGLMTIASMLLSVNFNAEWGFSLGALGIIAACVFWGMDNNFTRNISAKDPLTIVILKGLGSGAFSLALTFFMGFSFPAWGVIVGALVLGGLSYGISIVLFIQAMRGLGAARTSVLFSTAPISGFLLSIVMLRELPSLYFLMALPLMLIGTLFLVNEQHQHLHTHTAIIHEHAHVHTDGHHDHQHSGVVSAKQHSHAHEHNQLAHEHDHLPDIHHRHVDL